MTPPTQSEVRNRLLSLLPPADFERIAPHLVKTATHKGLVLCEQNTPIDRVFFPEHGVGSIIAVSPEGLEVEAGLFGREGFAPAAPVLDADRTSVRIVVQIPGEAWEIAPEPLVQAAEASTRLRKLLTRYVQTMLAQQSHTALSNAVHSIDQRLARWILMVDDRVDGGELPLTHEFISIMLGVRRPSVTTSLHVLEGHGFIRPERGCILVRNRAGLERFAGDAYGIPEAVYRDLIGPMR